MTKFRKKPVLAALKRQRDELRVELNRALCNGLIGLAEGYAQRLDSLHFEEERVRATMEAGNG